MIWKRAYWAKSNQVSNSIKGGNMAKRLPALECGPDFTKNLEGMFKDIDISADINTTFKVKYPVQ